MLDEGHADHDPEIARRFRVLHELPVPDVWDDVDRSAPLARGSAVARVGAWAIAAAAALVFGVIGVTWIGGLDTEQSVTATTPPVGAPHTARLEWSQPFVTDWLASAGPFEQARDPGREFAEQVLGWNFVRVGKWEVSGGSDLPDDMVGLTVFGPVRAKLEMLVVETEGEGWVVVGLGNQLALRTTEFGTRELVGLYSKLSPYAASVTHEVTRTSPSGTSVSVEADPFDPAIDHDGEIEHIIRVQQDITGKVISVDSYGLYTAGDSSDLVEVPTIAPESSPDVAMARLEAAGLHGIIESGSALALFAGPSTPSEYVVVDPVPLAATAPGGAMGRVELPAKSIVRVKSVVAAPWLVSIPMPDGTDASVSHAPGPVISWLDSAGPFGSAEELISDFSEQVLGWEMIEVETLPAITSLANPGELRHIEIHSADRAVHLLLANRSSGWRVLDLGGDGGVLGSSMAWAGEGRNDRGDLVFFPHRGTTVSVEVVLGDHSEVERVARVARDDQGVIVQLDAYGIGVLHDVDPYEQLRAVPAVRAMSALGALSALEAVGLHGLIVNPPPGTDPDGDSSWLADYAVAGVSVASDMFIPKGSFVDLTIEPA